MSCRAALTASNAARGAIGASSQAMIEALRRMLALALPRRKEELHASAGTGTGKPKAE